MVKKGYKQTEVGVIPEDWECVRIKDVATISMCKRIFANQTNTIGDVPFYKIGTFGKEADAYISNKLYVEFRYKFSFPQKGDILISAAGTLGRTVRYDGEKAYFQDSNIVWLDINKTRLCNEYLNQYYKVIKWASSEGSTIARLYNGIIYATYIPLPPLPEQHRIAKALSDMDSLISSLEKLIAKYKSIKAACLQQMFPQNGETVPRMRLPGFTDAWEQRKLNEITDVRDGTHDSPKYVPEGHPFITSKNVNNGFINYDDVQYVADEDYEEINKRSNVDVHDILMGMIGTIGNLALIRKEPNFAIKNVALIKYTGGIDYQYLFQALQANCVTSQLSTGMDGGTQKFVSLKKIRELDIPFPEEHEQLKIGAYFLYLDHLITLHQRKLEKVQKIKQGMMQQLLTGKIRLV